MFEGLSFDELNSLLANKRSLSFDQYFGEMELSYEEIQNRIELAEKLEDGFLFVLALLFTMQQQNTVNWERARQEYENRYLSALAGYVTITPYIRNYVRSMSYDVMDSTRNHQSNIYYYSPDRSRFMAENESNFARSYQVNEDAIASGFKKKRWITMRDKKVRETHREVDGQVKAIDDLFYVGGSLMSYPRDGSLGASSSEIVGCRCSIQYF